MNFGFDSSSAPALIAPSISVRALLLSSPVFTLYSFASREIITNRLGLYFTYARRALSTVFLLNFFSGDGASSRLFVDGYDTRTELIIPSGGNITLFFKFKRYLRG